MSQLPAAALSEKNVMDVIFRRLEKLEERSQQNEKLDRLLILLESRQEAQAKALDSVTWEVQELQRLLNANNSKLSFIAGSVENIENKRPQHGTSTLNLEIKVGDLEAQLRRLAAEVQATAQSGGQQGAQRDGLEEMVGILQDRIPVLVDQQIHSVVRASHGSLQQKLQCLEREVQMMKLSSASTPGVLAGGPEEADWPLLPALRQLVEQEVRQACEQIHTQMQREMDRELSRCLISMHGPALQGVREQLQGDFEARVCEACGAVRSELKGQLEQLAQGVGES
ncbi:hypothetical protein EON64_01735, partial [archaeon]